MKYLKICMMLALAFAPAAGFAGGEDSGAPFAHNRAPLAPKAYAELPLGAIRAQGWLLEMLERQRSGATGQMDRLYPGYGFAVHKGYGTKQHYAAIRELGATPIHRMSFLRKVH